jgi:signal transduction histidine kinase
VSPRSIRFKLAVWYLSVLLGALIVLGSGIWLALRHELYVSLDNSLAATVAGLSQYLQRESHGDELADVLEEAREYASGLPEGYRLQVFATDETLLLALPKTAPVTKAFHKSQDITVRGHHLRIQLSAPVQPVDLALSALRRVMIASIPIVFIVASIGGWWLSRTALSPVDRMTATAESIGLHDLSARLPVPKTGDELERFGEAWNRMLGRLAASVEKMKRFTADAAHELRTPVAVIRSTAELALRRDRDSAAYRNALGTIAETSVHLSELVSDLLWLARNDAHSINYVFEEVNIYDLIDSVLRSMAALAIAKEIALRTEFSLGPQQTVRVDRSVLRRCVMILADNAVKFTPPRGIVLIRTCFRDGCCVIEVRDDGPGIAPEDLPYIFDRFYTGDRSRNQSGFGLGLSIAKAAVEQHGGRIDVTTVAGEGSSFEILLPATRPQVSAKISGLL